MKTKYAFTNLIGTFNFNEQCNLIDTKLFKSLDEFLNLEQKNNLELLNEKQIKKILSEFRKEKFYKLFHERNLELTRIKVRESVKEDVLIMHTINNILDLELVANILAKDLREWYEIYNPEFSRAVKVHDKFVEMIIKKSKEELLSNIGISKKESIGADLEAKDITPITNLARYTKEIYQLKYLQEEYLESLMRGFCPNLNKVASTYIGARLIRHAGSLKNLMEMPASKIQMLGAEKALFRHMKSGSKPPKFGIIFQHPLIQKADKKNQGKVARALADKICIAVKVDYFNGEFIGDNLLRLLEEKFHNLPI